VAWHVVARRDERKNAAPTVSKTVLRPFSDSMGSVRVRALFAAALAIFTLGVSQASGAKPSRHAACAWGASSERARLVNGRIVTTPPARSGCVNP
jgi:hypothetical protein